MGRTTAASPVEISAERLKTLIDTDEAFTLIDTRDDESFDGWRISEAIQFFYKPAHEFDADEFIAETGVDRNESIITICAKGKSSGALADELVAAGFSDVRHVSDGMRGWSLIYDTVEIETDGPAQIIQIQRRAKGCLGYLLADPETGNAAVADPTRHTDLFRSVADENGWTITRVFDTHIHADHISGGYTLADELDVPYHLSERATERDLGFEYDALSRNEVVDVGTVEVKAVFTPGHTSGMASYLVDREAILTGDTIFVDSVGRTELQFGDADASVGAELLYDSLHGTILAEPDSISVLPGHFSVPDDGDYEITPGTAVSATIGELRREIPILRRERDDFVDRILQTVPEKPPNYEQIISINRGKAIAEEKEATELELGPNRCAAE